MSNSLWPRGLQQNRLPYPSLSPRVFSDSCPLSRWWYQIISFSVVPFSSCFQSFPASGSLPVSWLFASGGRSIGASASAAVLPMNIQSWFPLCLTGFISLQAKGLSRVLSSTTIWKHQSFFFLGGGGGAQPSLWSSSYIHTWQLEKPCLWLYRPFVGKVICLLFNTLSRFVSFSSKEHVSFNFMTAVTIHSDFGALENLSPFPLFPLLLTMKWWD